LLDPRGISLGPGSNDRYEEPNPSVRKEFPLAFSRLLACSILAFVFLLTTPVQSQESGQPIAAPAIDPGNDPWLSEQGLAVAAPVEVADEQVVRAWSEAPEAAYARAAALRAVRLELGVGDLLAPARVILNEATEDDPEIYTGFARDLAPGVPAIQLEHAHALAVSGDVGAATKATLTGLTAVARSLRAQLWAVENLSFLLLVVVLVTSLGFITLSALQVFPHVAHDLGDLLGGKRMPVFARCAALAALVGIPLVLGEGIIGLALSLFLVAFAYGKTRQRNVLAMAAALLVIGIHPLAQFVSVATTLVDQDPVAGSVMAVIDGTETSSDVERLESVTDTELVAAHALAYRDRRYGLEESSRLRLEVLGEQYPSDGFVLAGLGNIEMRRGDAEAAIHFYERAAAQVDSAALLFDLSQAYATGFRMEEYEATLSRAQKIDGDVVAELSSLGDPTLVADLQFPAALLRDRFVRLAMSEDPQFNLAAVLAPGRIGENWSMTAGSFVLAALFCFLFANRFDHASQCRRCGYRICTRCEETVWSEDICEDCHHLFKYSAATDPSLRMARLQALSRREVRIDRILTSGALFVPGIAGLIARRPDFAMFGLLLFGWVVGWALWPAGVFEDPLRMGMAAVLCLAVPGTLAVIGYSGIVLASLVARKKL
jgi:tetratricopeptide (TPR) repeat protein